MATAAKYPAALAALTDFGGELPSMPAAELTLNTQILSTDVVPISMVATTTIPTSFPATGWLVVDNELFHYSSYTAATFTIDVRAVQTVYGGGAAATHTAGAVIGAYLTAQGLNQMFAELVALEAQLQKNFMKRQAVTIATGTETVDLSLGDYIVVTLNANWTTPTISNPVDGHVYVFEFVQDATGSRTVAFPAAFKFSGGTKTLSTAAAAVDTVTAMYRGDNTQYRAVLATAYA